MDDIVTQIKNYLKILNDTIEDDDLLDFVINETLDRVEIYLNSKTVPTKLARILARIINTGLNKVNDEKMGTEQAISSLSDNGQSISYANEVKKYFTSTTDEELFSGFTSILSRYRRVKVVYPKDNETENS